MFLFLLPFHLLTECCVCVCVWYLSMLFPLLSSLTAASINPFIHILAHFPLEIFVHIDFKKLSKIMQSNPIVGITVNNCVYVCVFISIFCFSFSPMYRFDPFLLFDPFICQVSIERLFMWVFFFTKEKKRKIIIIKLNWNWWLKVVKFNA